MSIEEFINKKLSDEYVGKTEKNLNGEEFVIAEAYMSLDCDHFEVVLTNGLKGNDLEICYRHLDEPVHSEGEK